jgi:hypothetical protein
MAALTNSGNTPEMADGGRMQVYPLEANTTVYLGSIVALDANGNAVPASSVSTLSVIGRAEMTYGGVPGQDAINLGSAGAVSIVARRGVFMYSVNDASIGEAQIGRLAYAVDDNSVSASNGSGATAIVAQATTFPASSSAQIVTLGHEDVSSVRVHSASGGGTVYTQGTDYTVNYQSGLLMLIAGGGITAAATVFVELGSADTKYSGANRQSRSEWTGVDRFLAPDLSRAVRTDDATIEANHGFQRY